MSDWAWAVSYQKDEGHSLVLMERQLRYSYLIDLGGFLFGLANGRMWRIASWLRIYDLACWLINKGEDHTKTKWVIPISAEERKTLFGDEDWLGGIADDSD